MLPLHFVHGMVVNLSTNKPHLNGGALVFDIMPVIMLLTADESESLGE